MKQTAVEWLYEKILLTPLDIREINRCLEQAKEMELQQIEFFFKQGHLHSGCPYGLEEVYKKTFLNESNT